MKSTNIFLDGTKVYLRAFEPGDEKMVALLENHPDIRITTFTSLPVSAQQILERTQILLKDPNTIILTICDKNTGDAIGQTAFYRIDWVGRMATFYIGISNKKNMGKGFGTESVKLMLEYAFDILNLHRVQLHVATKNIAGIKAYENNGFTIEGTLKEAMYGNGEYQDFYLMAVLKNDYTRNKKH